MANMVSGSRLRFLRNKSRERLWIKPLSVCLISVALVFIAQLADGTGLADLVPIINKDSIETLLSIMAASMLVIATFSVSSMVSAYAAAGSTATPRAFSLVIADNASQNALSTFVGSFIYSVVALTAFKNEMFGAAGLFILFALTVIVFGAVIVTFVRWVDRIARLGRLSSTIDMVEEATDLALIRRREEPTLCGVSMGSSLYDYAVYATSVGYVQHIDVAAIQEWAEKNQINVMVVGLPGTFATGEKPLAYISDDVDRSNLIAAFSVGRHRTFNDDPRFGLLLLSEIAGRALSPGLNDNGTAIHIIDSLVRLFTHWNDHTLDEQAQRSKFDRVQVLEISIRDMFDDAFISLARDGAGVVEVAVRLQKALVCLAASGDAQLRDAAAYHSRLALKRSRLALEIEEDLAAVEDAAKSIA